MSHSPPAKAYDTKLIYFGRSANWYWDQDFVPTAIESMITPQRDKAPYRYDVNIWKKRKTSISYVPYVSITNSGDLPLRFTRFGFTIPSDIMVFDLYTNLTEEQYQMPYYAGDHKYKYNLEDSDEVEGTIPTLLPGYTFIYELHQNTNTVQFQAANLPLRIIPVR